MKKDRRTISVDVDEKIYPREAIFSAAYVFTDRAYVGLRRGRKGIKVELKAKNNLAAGAVKKLGDEFLNELIFSSLRVRLAKEHKKIREYMVERALFSATQAGTEAPADIIDDPLGIAVPWEEKYGQGKKSVPSGRPPKSRA